MVGIRLTSQKPASISVPGLVEAVAGRDEHGREIVAMALEAPSSDSITALQRHLLKMRPEVAGAILLCGREPRPEEWAEIARGPGTDRIAIYVTRRHRLEQVTPPPGLPHGSGRARRRPVEWSVTDSIALAALAAGIVVLVLGLIGLVG